MAFKGGALMSRRKHTRKRHYTRRPLRPARVVALCIVAATAASILVAAESVYRPSPAASSGDIAGASRFLNTTAVAMAAGPAGDANGAAAASGTTMTLEQALGALPARLQAMEDRHAEFLADLPAEGPVSSGAVRPAGADVPPAPDAEGGEFESQGAGQ